MLSLSGFLFFLLFVKVKVLLLFDILFLTIYTGDTSVLLLKCLSFVCWLFLVILKSWFFCLLFSIFKEKLFQGKLLLPSKVNKISYVHTHVCVHMYTYSKYIHMYICIHLIVFYYVWVCCLSGCLYVCLLVLCRHCLSNKSFSFLSQQSFVESTTLLLSIFMVFPLNIQTHT